MHHCEERFFCDDTCGCAAVQASNLHRGLKIAHSSEYKLNHQDGQSFIAFRSSLLYIPYSGWDSIYYGAEQDAELLGYGDAGGHFYLMKEQSWVSQWSSTYSTWYFGTGVTTSNDFYDDPMWYFYFERGAAAGNGETYTGDMYVVGAEITYQAVQ
jgi:hypothetical protein